MTREQMLADNDKLVHLKEVRDEIERDKARLIRATMQAKKLGNKHTAEIFFCKKELAKLNKQLKSLSFSIPTCSD